MVRSAAEEAAWQSQRKDLLRSLNHQTYQGDSQDGRFEGQGKFTFPNATGYQGGFTKGRFHGAGTVSFPGQGQFVGEWRDGILESGKYIFSDKLEFSVEDWKFCLPKGDRRFWSEIHDGVTFNQTTRLTDRQPAPLLAAGCFDVGDGYYDPEDDIIYKFDGQYLRTPDADEVHWAKHKCRVGTIETTKPHNMTPDQQQRIRDSLKPAVARAQPQQSVSPPSSTEPTTSTTTPTLTVNPQLETQSTDAGAGASPSTVDSPLTKKRELELSSLFSQDDLDALAEVQAVARGTAFRRIERQKSLEDAKEIRQTQRGGSAPPQRDVPPPPQVGHEMSADDIARIKQIQAVQRGRQARNEVQHKKILKQANLDEQDLPQVERIQSLFRGRRDRELVASLRQQQSEPSPRGSGEEDFDEQHVAKVQAIFRGKKARTQVQTKKALKQANLEEEDLDKVRLIQAMARSKAHRKQAQDSKQQSSPTPFQSNDDFSADDVVKISRIQARHRGNQDRKQLKSSS